MSIEPDQTRLRSKRLPVDERTTRNRKGSEAAGFAGKDMLCNHCGIANEPAARQLESLCEQIEITDEEEIWFAVRSNCNRTIRIIRHEALLEP